MMSALAEKPRRANMCLVLGIESSCDETAASVLRLEGGHPQVLSSVIASQDEKHAPFGGVVPEIAARAHMEKIETVTKRAMQAANVQYCDLDAIAATAGPGLIGGVITGLQYGKGLALSLGRPLLAINHLEGHALSPRLSDECPFPYLLLLVSGGHTQLLAIMGLGDYRRLGSTIDDAAGEAFDKTAKIMGLGFPGGPALERLAKAGDPNSVALPCPLRGKPNADFSFAGLKTAAARAFAALGEAPSQQAKADLAASFQHTVAAVLHERSGRAFDMFDRLVADSVPKRFVVAGGVAANQSIRESLMSLSAQRGYAFSAPPLKYCTDNAAMIALAGAEHFADGRTDTLAARARPRWPLDGESAAKAPKSGSGKKGPKS